MLVTLQVQSSICTFTPETLCNRSIYIAVIVIPNSLRILHFLLLIDCDFLANVNVSSRSLYAIARPSVVCLSSVCNVRAPYLGGSNFRQYFYGI